VFAGGLVLIETLKDNLACIHFRHHGNAKIIEIDQVNFSALVIFLLFVLSRFSASAHIILVMAIVLWSRCTYSRITITTIQNW